MARVGVSVKLDVTKVDKERLFRGAKGTYLDATVFIDLDEADQYGNHGMVTQDVSKEERQSGVKGPILGNVKVFYRDDQQQQSQQPNYQQAQADYAQRQGQPQGGGGGDDFSDEIPFAAMHNMMGG